MNFVALAIVAFSITLCTIIRLFDRQFFPIQWLFGIALIAFGSFELYNLLSMQTSIIGRLRDSLQLKVSWYAFFYLFVIYLGISQLFKKKMKENICYHKNYWKAAAYTQKCSTVIYDVFAKETEIDLTTLSSEEKKEICIHVTCGSATILLSRDARYIFQTETKMGNITLPSYDETIHTDHKKENITLHLRAVLGSIVVKYN